MLVSPTERFEKAWQICSSLWFPINEAHLRSTIAELDHSSSRENKDLIIAKIKEDPALFCHCIREASYHFHNSKKKGPRPQHPSKLLATLELSHIEQILKNARSHLSPHSFTQMTRLQAEQLHELLVTASTVETLSHAVNIDPETGYTTALVRQLGYTLIAWNYPRIFERAMKRVATGEERSRVFYELLGFSPYLLGITTATEWQLGLEIKASLGDNEAINKIKSDRNPGLGRTALLLRKFCRVGEQLAQALRPEQFPSAGSDWSEARREIEEVLGPDGLVIVQTQVKKACGALFNGAPAELQEIFRESSEIDFTVPSGLEAFAQNKAIKKLPEKTQGAVKSLYRQSQSSKVEQRLIQLLVKNVIPDLGFNRGCIYLFDPTEMQLNPVVLIGEGSLTNYHSHPFSPLADEEHYVVQAFKQSDPLLFTDGWENPQKVTFAGVFGRIHRVGVLVLSGSTNQHERASEERLLNYFVAVRTCLQDFLKLR